jgi:hypothetical protein
VRFINFSNFTKDDIIHKGGEEMDYIREKFSAIEDKRHNSYVEHELSDVLIMIMCSVLCGLDGLAELVVLSEKKAAFFRRKFGIEQL